MDIEIMLNFNAKDPTYIQSKKELESIKLLESIRKAIDYSVLLNDIEHLTDTEDRWATYYNIVVETARKLLYTGVEAVNKKQPNLEPETVKSHVVYFAIYRTFNGFESEHIITEKLANDGYTILADNIDFTYLVKDRIIESTYKQYLDSKFGIDLRAISPAGELIGIQVKSESYINLPFDRLDKYENSIKDTHREKHQKAINNGFCKDVYFIFHRDNSAEILHLKRNNNYLIKSHLVTKRKTPTESYIKYNEFIDRKKAY